MRFSCLKEVSSLLPNPAPNWRITVLNLERTYVSSDIFRFFFSSSTSRSPNPTLHSFTLSYLINSCGLSPQSALSASQKVHLVTPKRSDSVIFLLRHYGINDTQLSKLVKIFPTVLLNDPEKTLLPKLQFLDSKPFSRADICKILSSCPMILSRSLENQIIPIYNFLKSVLHLDQRVVFAIKRSPRILLEDLNKNIVPNIALLQETGAPESSIVFFVTYSSNELQMKHDRFVEIVKEVLGTGFNPKTVLFITAVKVFAGTSKSIREQKMEIYRRWGWSDEEIMALIRAFPIIMSLSEKKIMGTMDFLVNKMGWKLNDISSCPLTLGFNLEKRIIPRCLVGKVLMLKGLINKDLRLSTLMSSNENKFLERFVIKYQNQIPGLLNLYKGQVGGFASQSQSGIN